MRDDGMDMSLKYFRRDLLWSMKAGNRKLMGLLGLRALHLLVEDDPLPDYRRGQIQVLRVPAVQIDGLGYFEDADARHLLMLLL